MIWVYFVESFVILSTFGYIAWTWRRETEELNRAQQVIDDQFEYIMNLLKKPEKPTPEVSDMVTDYDRSMEE